MDFSSVHFQTKSAMAIFVLVRLFAHNLYSLIIHDIVNPAKGGPMFDKQSFIQTLQHCTLLFTDSDGVSSISTKSDLSESGWELTMLAPLHLQSCI